MHSFRVDGYAARVDGGHNNTGIGYLEHEHARVSGEAHDPCPVLLSESDGGGQVLGPRPRVSLATTPMHAKPDNDVTGRQPRLQLFRIDRSPSLIVGKSRNQWDVVVK